MESAKPSQAAIAFKWAIISLVTSIAITMIYQFTGVDQNGPIKYLGFIPLILFIILCQNDYRKANQGFMNYGDGFVQGLLFGVFAGLLGAVFTYVYMSYINPQILEQAIADSHAALVARGMSPDQIERADEFTRKWGALFGVVGSVIGTPIIAAIISLITAAILKKERTLSDIENQASSADPTV